MVHKLPHKAPTPRDDSESYEDDVGLVLCRPPVELSATKPDIALLPVQPPSSPPHDQIETPNGSDNHNVTGGDPPQQSTLVDAVPDLFNNPALASSEPTEITGQIFDSGQPAPDHQAMVTNESETLLASRPQWIRQPSSLLSILWAWKFIILYSDFYLMAASSCEYE